ncbi:LysR family transcriptional regulator [Aminipila butyrica]|uniref:LysR family transcriptional regulator n=1 Tax=Aminipila butyrica TaxID=433296 RepID=A0A858BRY0_9FIRM|nr:LysR family transcriptional regulator [Aminipila butyrica]QIB68701.1 LysR family transcriptional regulator [Aminipila butyrica]
MEIRNLEAFLLLARSLNFTKSAEQMFLSQSAFSRQIIRLEEEMGCQLFRRTKRNVELTTHGKQFLEHAEIIVSEYNKSLVNLKDSIKKNGLLRLGLLNDLVDETFPKIIRDFVGSNPELDVIYSDNSMSSLINNLLRDEIDCAYTLSHDAKNVPGISSYTVWSESVYIAVSCNHPLAEKTSLKIKDLAGAPFVIPTPDTYNLGVLHMTYLCKNAGFVPNVAAMVSDVNSLMMLVSSDVGIAFTARTAKNTSLPGVKFLPVEKEEFAPLETDITILWKTENPNPAIKNFLKSAENIVNSQESEKELL